MILHLWGSNSRKSGILRDVSVMNVLDQPFPINTQVIQLSRVAISLSNLRHATIQNVTKDPATSSQTSVGKGYRTDCHFGTKGGTWVINVIGALCVCDGDIPTSKYWARRLKDA